MTGTDKWPRELDAAIKEEIVRAKLRPVQVWEKVCAGTLVDGLDSLPVPKRTFYYRWTRAQHELRRVEQAAEEFPRLIHRLMVAMLDNHEDLGPEQVAEAIRERFGEEWTPAETQQVIDARVAHRNCSEPAQAGRNP